MALIPGLMAGACVSVDEGNFPRPAPDNLTLGRTTIADAIAKYGQPRSRSKRVGNAGDIETLDYLYAPHGTNGQLIRGDFRQLSLSFSNERLISHTYVSSFPSDFTRFDERKFSSFVVGQTTWSDILRELGRPSGEGIYPFVADRGGSMLFYSYLSVTRDTGYSGNTTESINRGVRFTFDSSDKITRIDMTTGTVPKEPN
jgi:hypothetical protein